MLYVLHIALMFFPHFQFKSHVSQDNVIVVGKDWRKISQISVMKNALMKRCQKLVWTDKW